MQISLDYMKVRGRYGQKCAKNGEKTGSVRPENQFFEKVLDRYDDEIFLYRTQMVPKGPWWSRKNFSFGQVF